MNRLKARSRGLSLIEVLVSMLVVSTGILSLAALSGVALRLGKTSEHRAVALLLANDIGERVRANLAAAQTGLYDQRPAYAQASRMPALQPCADGAACSAAELAVADLAEWQRALYQALPNGLGMVRLDDQGAAAPLAVDVWVTWLDPVASAGDPVASDECPAAYRGLDPQPRCLYARFSL